MGAPSLLPCPAVGGIVRDYGRIGTLCGDGDDEQAPDDDEVPGNVSLAESWKYYYYNRAKHGG